MQWILVYIKIVGERVLFFPDIIKTNLMKFNYLYLKPSLHNNRLVQIEL